MERDRFKETREIIQLLRDEGASQLALDIENAYKGSSTGTEFLLSVRFYLNKVPKEAVSNTTYERIQSLIKHLTKLFELGSR